MGVALPLPGRGGGISPHMKAFLHRFLNVIGSVSKNHLHRVYARKGILWDATSHVAGGVGRAAPQNKHTHFYARKAQFGIKRPAFTRGHEGNVSPISHHTRCEST